jgi:catalase
MIPRRTLLAAFLATVPAAARSQDDLGTQLTDALEALFGAHPGARRAHAKGRLYDGRFLPDAGAARLSRAPQFAAGTTTPLVVRFSDGTGLPNIPDGNPNAVPQGLAVRFLTPDGSPNDIVSNAAEGFQVRNGEDFVAFLRAVAASGPGAASPTPLQRFLDEHPETKRFVTTPRQTPRSFTTNRYFGNNALRFVSADGGARAIRYVVEPEAGVETLTAEEARARPADFLFDELAARLASGPARFTLLAQVAAPGDPTNDATILWPADRQRARLGTIEVTGAHADQADERQLFFDPNNLPDGIEISDDPLLPARGASYAVSITRRTAN